MEIIKLKKVKKYKDKYLLDSLKLLAKKIERTPTIEDVKISKDCPNPSTYRDHFGSYIQAIKKIGLESDKKYYTKEDLINSLRKLYNKFGRAPRYDKDFGIKNNMPSSKTFGKRFGSFNNALRLAGIPITKEYKRYNNNKLITILKLFAKKIGKTPRRKDFYYNKNMPDPNTYKIKFGSFNKAIKLAGLEINNSKFFYYTNKELLNLLTKISKKLGRTPNNYDFKHMKELPSMWIYHKRFGSYTNAVLEVGLKPNKGFSDKLAIYWQNHCVEIAKDLFDDIKTNKGHNKKVGKPDIWIKKNKIYIDANLSLFHVDHIKSQIERYTKDGYKLQFWCLKKMPDLEINNKKIKYIYAEDMVELFKQNLSEDLIAKTNQFIMGRYSPYQKSIKNFIN